MRKASVRDLHIRTSELVREAAEGGIIVIERRGEPVAELRPLTVPEHACRCKNKDLHVNEEGLGSHAAGER